MEWWKDGILGMKSGWCPDFNFWWGPFNKSRSHSAKPSIALKLHCVPSIPLFHYPIALDRGRVGNLALPLYLDQSWLNHIITANNNFGARIRLTVRCRKGWKWSTAWDVLALLLTIKSQGITFKGDINQNIFQNYCALCAIIDVDLFRGRTCLCRSEKQPDDAIL